MNQPEILQFIYPKYVIAVIVFTEVIKWIMRDADFHPKWVTLSVAFVVGLIGAIVDIMLFHYVLDFYQMLTSFGVSIIGYDYILKPLKDRINKEEDHYSEHP